MSLATRVKIISAASSRSNYYLEMREHALPSIRSLFYCCRLDSDQTLRSRSCAASQRAPVWANQDSQAVWAKAALGGSTSQRFRLRGDIFRTSSQEKKKKKKKGSDITFQSRAPRDGGGESGGRRKGEGKVER